MPNFFVFRISQGETAPRNAIHDRQLPQKLQAPSSARLLSGHLLIIKLLNIKWAKSNRLKMPT